MFFIAGITGNVGGAAAQRLLDEGHTVRAVVRDPAKAAGWAAKGVDVKQGDWTDTAVVAAALEGVEGAFVMVPPKLDPKPGYPESVAVIASLVDALRKTPVPRVVGLSSIGSEQESGLGLITATHLLEEALKPLPFPVAFVRAGSFFENYAHGIATVKATGNLYSFYLPAEKPVPTIATADIGKEVAKLLTQGWSGKTKVVELGSLVSPVEAAEALGKALGQPVKAVGVPREGWAGAFGQMGMQPGTTWAYEEMLDGVNSGWIHFGVEGTEAVAGTMTAEQFFASAVKG